MVWVIHSKTIRLLFAIFCLAVVLHLSEKNLRSSCHLSEAAYFSSTIIVGGLTHSLAFAATLLFAVLGAVLYRQRRWHDCPCSQAFRYLVLASAATLTWAAATYPHNYYFDQSHTFDRLLIVILFLLLMRWPSLVGIFAVEAFAILSQFDQPFGGFSWTDKDLPLRVLLLFGASFWLSISVRRQEWMRAALLMTFSLIASHYFVPGWEKFTTGWQSYGNLHYLFAAGHVNGWLDINAQQVTQCFDATRRIEPWLIVATLALECGAIALMANRRLAVGLLVGWAGLHVGIFVFSGICFWKWLVVDLTAAFVLASINIRELQWLFHGVRPWIAFLLVAFGQPIFKSHHLAWFDTPLAHTYRFVGIDSAGNRHGIGKYQLAPYDFFLCQNRLWFIPQSELLTRTWSSTKKSELALSLVRCNSLDQLASVKPAEQIVRPDVNRQQGFERWVQVFFRNMTKHHRLGTRGSTGFPQHIWTTALSSDCPPAVELVAVELYRTSSWCEGGVIRILEDSALVRVELNAESQPTAEYYSNFSDQFLSPSHREHAMLADLPIMNSPPTVSPTGKLVVGEEDTIIAERSRANFVK